ncbi:UNVERIFIED_CONTAM: hypothetical protein GTU68_055381 [Idotea baltica]|nr:hypothetical protein [Idotea baltica]
MAASSYDVIVIGAGPGGYVAAIRAAQLGLKVAVVEREHMGGICLNWGCIPTKAMLRSSEVFHLMHRAKEFGLKADGIGYDLEAVVARSRAIAKQLNGGVGHLLKKNKVTAIMGEATLPAKGIVGNTEGLGLEALGVKVDRTHVVTDAYCRTDVEGVFAIGDIAGAPWLAHKASHEGVMVAELIAGGKPHPVKPESIAGCTYCHPQVASVGLTEAKAKEAGLKIKVGRFPFIGNGKAIALGEPEGLIKTIFNEKTGELLGAHMIGAEVTELIQGYVVGQKLETTEEDLMETVFPHPTLSEMMHESVLDAYDRVIHI